MVATIVSRRSQALFLMFNFVATIAVTFINKTCFSRVNFGYPAALSNVHYVITWLGVECMRRLGLFEPLKIQPTLLEKNFLAIVLVVGVVTPLNNASLKLNGMGFYQIFKLLVTPVVVALEYLLDGTVVSLTRGASLLAVCCFVLFSSRTSTDISVWGTLAACVWVPLAALYKVQWGRVKKLYHNCSTLALMHAVYPYAIVVQALISPVVDPPGLLQYRWTPEAVFWIFLSGIAAFLVNFSGFLVMGNIGALAHVLLGQLKTSVIMVGAYFIFGSRYSSLQLVGAMGAVGAIVAYTHVTVSEEERKKQAVSLLEADRMSIVSNNCEDREPDLEAENISRRRINQQS